MAISKAVSMHTQLNLLTIEIHNRTIHYLGTTKDHTNHQCKNLTAFTGIDITLNINIYLSYQYILNTLIFYKSEVISAYF